MTVSGNDQIPLVRWIYLSVNLSLYHPADSLKWSKFTCLLCLCEQFQSTVLSILNFWNAHRQKVYDSYNLVGGKVFSKIEMKPNRSF